MAYSYNTITDILNQWDQIGVFTYVIPFLLIFAVVFAMLQKTRVLGDNRTVQGIVGVSIGLLALQFDFVSTFFAEIFPRFGVGLAIFLIFIILIGFFHKADNEGNLTGVKWIGYLCGIGVVVWAVSSWNFWRDNWSLGWWFSEYFWPLIILAGVIIIIVTIGRSGGDGGSRRSPVSTS